MIQEPVPPRCHGGLPPPLVHATLVDCIVECIVDSKEQDDNRTYNEIGGRTGNPIRV
jgi:hypothetical protein